jgi:hypothetical protein
MIENDFIEYVLNWVYGRFDGRIEWLEWKLED